ncbi:protein of unknown function [Bradyrhizobium sp. ORS 285]|nr:hypothetical protein BRAO285_850037 [Bradyrhizobium sp. ORS 285]SMX61535.1 protein of unknown function [Bradyrhizobium sp. ORS 285]
MDPINSYECDMCGKCYNGTDERIMCDPRMTRRCYHGADIGISHRVYTYHMDILTAA